MFLSTMLNYFTMDFSLMYYYDVSLYYVVLFYTGFLFDVLLQCFSPLCCIILQWGFSMMYYHNVALHYALVF